MASASMRRGHPIVNAALATDHQAFLMKIKDLEYPGTPVARRGWNHLDRLPDRKPSCPGPVANAVELTTRQALGSIELPLIRRFFADARR
jgi:hypothetical protein